MKTRQAKIEQMERDRQRPPGYTEACLAAASKVDDEWVYFTPEAYRLLANRYRPQPIPEDFSVEHEKRRTRQGGCCGQPSDSPS